MEGQWNPLTPRRSSLLFPITACTAIIHCRGMEKGSALSRAGLPVKGRICPGSGLRRRGIAAAPVLAPPVVNSPAQRKEEMAWIRIIKEDDAHGFLRSLYKKYGNPFEGVDNILKIHSLNPDTLKLHYDFYKQLMTGRSGLSRMQREMIAVVVSVANNCHY